MEVVSPVGMLVYTAVYTLAADGAVFDTDEVPAARASREVPAARASRSPGTCPITSLISCSSIK